MSDRETAPQEAGESSKLPGKNTGNDTVQQVFSMFKSDLEERFDKKGKEFELKSKTEKEIVQLKYKGNQKQFELNVQIDSILDSAQGQKLVEQGTNGSALVNINTIFL